MKKTTKILGGLGAVILATSLSNDVLASELTNTQNNTDTSATSTNATNDSVTLEEVNKAANEFKQAEKEVQDQTRLVSQLETQVRTATTAETSAKNQLKISETRLAKSEADVSRAQNLVSSSEASLNAATEQETVADQALQQAQTAVSEQEASLQQDQVALKQAQDELTAAKQEVRNAQAALSNRTRPTLVSQVNTAKREVTQLTNQANTVINQINGVQNGSLLATPAIRTAENNLAKTQTNHHQQEQALAQATVENEQAAKKLADAEKALADAQPTQPSRKTDTVATIPADYITALRQYSEAVATRKPTAAIVNRLKQIVVSNNLITKGNFTDSDADRKVVFATNDIPTEIQTELSLYASDIINQVRQQIGTNLTTVTTSSVDFANRVATNYVTDKWPWGAGHDNAAISRAAGQLGLNNTGQYYENMYSLSPSRSSLSLNEAKRLIFTSVAEFMFNDEEYDHANAISGLMNEKATKATYLGLDFSDRAGVLGTHFLTVETHLIKAGSPFSTTPISASQSVSPTLIKNVETARTQFNQTQSKLLQEQGKFNTTKQHLEQAQQNLAQAKQTEVTNLEKKLEQINSRLALAQNKLSSAEAALRDMDASASDKQAALNQARQKEQEKTAALTQRQAKLNQSRLSLNSLKNNLTKARQSLSTAKLKVGTAKTQLTRAKANLANLEANKTTNLQANLKAKNNVEQATALLQQKTTDLQAAKVKLNDLKSILKEKSAIYTQLYNKYRANQRYRSSSLTRSYTPTPSLYRAPLSFSPLSNQGSNTAPRS